MAKASGETEPAFVADAMLARLARWLRVMGLDTRYDPALEDPDLVDLADREDRILLTCDRHLVTFLRPRRAVHLRSEPPLAQLRVVVHACGITLPRDLFTRCLLCNATLRNATDGEIKALVPERAQGRGGPYLRCPRCERLYWPGTHVRRMREALAREFPQQYS